METTHPLKTIPDDELLRRLVDLLHHSRRTEADLVAHIGEVDARRLYARKASPSMFVYSTERLHLSDAEAYLRIAAARASREHPVLLEMLADGRLHLTAIARLAPHLTPQNREELLERATHRTKREIEELVAEIAPRPDAATVVRRLPERRPVPPPVAAPELRPEDPTPETPPVSLRPDAVAGSRVSHQTRPAVVEPLAPGRYKIQFTASAGLRDKLERLRGLMRASVPDGDLAAIIEQAVTEKLERLEARRFARTKAPGKALPTRSSSTSGRERSAATVRGSSAPEAKPTEEGEHSASTEGRLPDSRHIPAAVRRAVDARDGGRCRYVDEQGWRCTAREGLEFHHRHPFGYGGRHLVDEISLLCRVHNLYLAEVDYGQEAMVRHRRSKAASGSQGLGA